MRKSVTKIVKATVAFAMAIGASVGAAMSSPKANPVYASTGSYTLTFDANSKNDGSGTSCASDGSTALTTSNIFSYASYNFTVSKVKYYWLVDGHSNIASVSSTTNCYPGKDSTMKVGKSAGDGTISFTVSGTANLSIDSVSITAYGTATSAKITIDEATEQTKQWSLSTSSDTHTFVYSSAVKTVTLTGGAGLASSNKIAYISQIVINYTVSENPVPTVTGVNVTGNMSPTSYTTVQQWSHSGLTATATMSDSSPYSGEFNWSYSPTNPAAAVIANSGNEIVSTSVTATASAGGKSGSKATSGISVSYATVAQGLAAIPNLNDQISGAIVKGKVSYVDSVDTSTYYNATYFISDDGTRSDEIEVYRGKGVENANITNVNDIKVGDNVVVYGDLKYYDGSSDVQEFLQGNYLLSLDRPVSQEPSITITDSSFTMFVGDGDVDLSEIHENVPDGGSIKWVSGTPAVATVDISTGLVHAVAPGTVEITAKIVNSSDEMVASNSIVVSVVKNYLSDGDAFVIKSTYSATDYYFTGITENLGTSSTDSSEAIIFTAIESATPGVFKFKNGNHYLSYSGSTNAIYTSTDGTAASVLWTAIDNGTSIVVESNNVSGRKLQFNYNGGNTRFACYTSNQTAITLEKIVLPEVDEVTILGDATADASGATAITKVFLYEVSYVDPLNLGDESVEVEISGGLGASVTEEPSAGSFSVTFTANGTFVITVTSVENPSESASTSITVSNVYVRSFSLYTGTNSKLVEGDYIIYYSSKALKASIDKSRAQNETVSPSEDVVSSNDSSIIWHIAPAGDYFTIYNAAIKKYLAATDSKNEAQLIADGTDDKAKWTVTIDDGVFEFENYARANSASNPSNKWLRNNGANGWACYSTSTGGALSLYRLGINDYLKAIDSVATLHGNETTVGNVTTVDSVLMRFGALISKADWDSINAEWPITDYGVMAFRTTEANLASVNTVKGYYELNPANVSIIRKNSGTAPTLVDGFYDFSVQINFTNTTSFNRIYCVAPFIVAGGNYHFLTEMRYSVNSLASYYQTNGGSTLSADALTYLATTH